MAWPFDILPKGETFSQNYGQARSRLKDAATRRGAILSRYTNNRSDLECELTTDIAWLGPQNASRVMILVSGTHGVEGYVGSAAQLMLLNSDIELFPDTAILLVHAINPFGFACDRRTTEGNVDLNRNGIDFAEGLVENPHYAMLSDAFSPRGHRGVATAQSLEALAEFERGNGELAVREARTMGQHSDPNGIHFGGYAPTWSHETILQICSDHALSTRRWVAVVDFHTGLGPFGYGEPICGCRPQEPGRDLMRKWYGPSLTEPLLGTSSSVVIPGLSQYIWGRGIGIERYSFIALEFGTIPAAAMSRIMASENWLYAYGDPTDGSSETARIVRDFREAYDLPRDDWREMVLWRSAQVIGQTLGGLKDI